MAKKQYFPVQFISVWNAGMFRLPLLFPMYEREQILEKDEMKGCRYSRLNFMDSRPMNFCLFFILYN